MPRVFPGLLAGASIAGLLLARIFSATTGFAEVLVTGLAATLTGGFVADLTAVLVEGLAVFLVAGLTDCLDCFIDLIGVAAFFAVALVDTGDFLTAVLTTAFTACFAVGFAFFAIGLTLTNFFAGLALADLRIAAAVFATTLATTFASERVGFADFFAWVLATGFLVTALAAGFAVVLTCFLTGVRAFVGMAILRRYFDAPALQVFRSAKCED